MGQKRTEESQTDRWAGKPDVCVMSDAVAEALEAAGLYRRAARRWLEVLDRCRDCDERARLFFCFSVAGRTYRKSDAFWGATVSLYLPHTSPSGRPTATYG